MKEFGNSDDKDAEVSSQMFAAPGAYPCPRLCYAPDVTRRDAHSPQSLPLKLNVENRKM